MHSFMIDSFRKYGWTIQYKKCAQIMGDEFSNNIPISRRKPKLIETDDRSCKLNFNLFSNTE